MINRLIFLAVSAMLFCTTMAQDGFAFRHLTAEQGLSDGVVRAIGQDKYGYLWISTLSGLNRFDGYTVKTFYNNPSDSTSLPPYTVQSIFQDNKGRLWLGSDKGLAQYDYGKAAFRQVSNIDFYVSQIAQLSSGQLLLNTGKGLQLFNPESGRCSPLSFPISKIAWAYSFFVDDSSVYIASHLGLWRYNVQQQTMQRLRTEEVTAVAMDGKGALWFVTNNRTALNKGDTTGKAVQSFGQFATSPTGYAGGGVFKLFVDRQGELWAATNVNGLLHYNSTAKQFEQYLHNPSQQTSLSSNLITQIYQSARGYLWIGTEGLGVNYFHPERKLFSQLPVPVEWAAQMPVNWMRSFVVDKQGNYWVGAGAGLLHLTGNAKALNFFHNSADKPPQLQSNSIRSLLCDDAGDVWIGTSDGVNKWDVANKRMLFLTNKDSLPPSFYWTMLQDRDGTLWFGERGGLHYKTKGAATIRSVVSHPVLQRLKNRNIRSLFEDREGRLWFGTDNSGLVMWNKKTNNIEEWQRSEGKDTLLLSNLIVDIAEDRNGNIWLSSFTGLTMYNPATKKFRWYTEANGLPSVKTSSLLVDEKNRLWIGSTKGLLLLDSAARRFTSFTTADGLPAMEFSDMRGSVLPDGRFAVPTVNGMLLFNPMDYQPERRSLDVWLSSIAFLGQTTPLANPEDTRKLDLHWDQNFFTIGLTAVHYSNPDAVWYAYQLDGFDEDWQFTKSRMATYTNVPGGAYTFRYKATTDPNDWNVPEKALAVHIGIVYYKAVWFWVLVGGIALASLVYWYKSRERQQQRIFSLQSKAQALEKEKTAVLYESLKQQLNPHFLFNSLTSLNSLIKADQKLATEFLEGMSKIYRYILKSRDAEVVTLKEELELVGHYIRLQQTRFETGFTVQINVGTEYFDKKIAPVTLQNLVENAIKHNIIDDESPLVVSLYVDKEWLVVRNNLQKKNFVESSNKQGLAQMQSLYRYLTGKRIEVIADKDFFTVKVPLI